MKLIIEINLDNEAYKDNSEEIQENLENIIVKLNWGDTNGIIFDSNGNKTGQWRIDDED
jgi:hypothetical protein